MTWRVVLPGQPPSGNHLYDRNRGGQGLHKKPGVEAYQAGVTRIVASKRPSGWRPDIDVIVEFRFHFGRSVDCTNAMKVLEDAIAEALCPHVTQNPPTCCRAFDNRFLCRAMTRSVGFRDPYVVVDIT